MVMVEWANQDICIKKQVKLLGFEPVKPVLQTSRTLS